jgi:hypothetical protein
METVKRLRTRIRPDIRQALDGVAFYFVITLFVCLIQSAHDGIVKRNPAFDQQRWWFPIYKGVTAFEMKEAANCGGP